jgi:hypothetical protein
MNNQSLREELRKILTIVADLAHNNTNASVKDIGVIEEAKSLLEHEVRNHLDELDSRGLIKYDIKVTGANFRHLSITRDGLEELENQDLR